MTAGLSFCAAARTHRGAVRKSNEDAVFVGPEKRLWAVADGMGGHAGGEIASACVADALEKADISAVAPERGAREAIAAANRILFARNRSVQPPGNMGTTVALLGMDDGRFFCLWAGDSRIYRLRASELMRLTRDHSYVDELVASGALSPAEAENHPQRHVITRAIGISEEPDLERRGGDVRSGDSFMLLTDGVVRVCSDKEIAQAMMASVPEEAADDLARRCLARGAPDNFSFILLLVV